MFVCNYQWLRVEQTVSAWDIDFISRSKKYCNLGLVKSEDYSG
jgi:hypothetical protein